MNDIVIEDDITIESDVILEGSIDYVSVVTSTTFGLIEGEVEDNAKLVTKFATKQDVIDDLDEIRTNATKGSQVASNLDNEIKTRQQQDELLQKSIADLDNRLVAETSIRLKADTQLQSLIDLKANQSDLDTTNINVSTNTINITKEIIARQQGDEKLQKAINDLNITSYLTKSEASNMYATKTSLATVATTGSYNDLSDKPDIPSDLSDYIKKDYADSTYATKTLVSNETTRAKEAENTLTNSLSSEVTRAKSAEKNLTTNLTTEINRATKAETTLTTNLNNEIARAKQEESTISTNLTNEISRAKKAEETLTTNLATEVSDRKKADTDLQTQIDAINSRSDVVDVVATKADLDAYSKDITVDDIIKVLQDETQNNATAYYRNTAKSKPYVWELVGVLGPYYTQGQVKELIDAEADTRAEADTALQGNIDAEVSRAQSAENTLANDLSSEVIRAKSAEETMTNNLSAEVTRATNAETTLTDGLGAEITRAKNEESTLATNLSDETTRAKAKEEELETALKACYTKDEIDALLENLIEINK